MLRFAPSRLRARLLGLILLTLLPALGLLLYADAEGRRLAIDNAHGDALRLAHLAASRHEDLLGDARQMLTTLAQLPQVRGGDAAACSTLFASVLAHSPQYTNLTLVRPDGMLHCSALPPSAPVSLADRAYFQRTLLSRQFTVGEYVIGRVTGRAALPLAYPILDEAGSVRAVLVAALDLAWLDEFAAEAQLPPGATLLLLDHQATVLARHPEPGAWAGQTVAETPLGRAVLARQGDGTADVAGLDGTPRLFAFTRLRGLPEASRVSMVVGIPTALALGAVDRLLQQQLAGLVLVAALTVAVAWVGSETILLRPITALLAATRRLAAGDLGARTGLPPGTDELSQLARTFDDMGDALERRAAQLRQAEAQYRTLVEQLPVVTYMLTMGPSDHLLYISPQIESLLGFAPAAWLADPDLWRRQLHPDDRDGVLAAMAQSRATGEPFRAEYRLLARDGRVVWVYDETVVVRDEAGGPQWRQGVLLDISARKRAEEARLAREAADEASRAKSEFLSRMSHELRTPLNAILGFAQLLELDALTPDQAESVAQIRKGGHHLVALINEVLDIARIEAGRLSLSLEPVPLAAVLAESLDLIQPLAAQRQIHLDGPAGDGAWYVLADRQRLKQVLLNLLSNAVKYNHEQGTVACAGAVTADGWLRLTVRDTGPGIPAERLGRLFTPFDRLGAEQTGVEGTGLGLALSKRLVEAMGGRLGADSTPGQGSAFWVELPPALGLELAAAPPDVGVPVPAPAPGAARTVLYIEDNLPNLTLVERILAHRPGLRLVTAMQGRLGLELLREHRPDLVLLDLHLPDISGQEVLRQLQADPRTRAIPVLLLSADATPGQIERLLAAGARAYLTKPLDVKQFLEVLDATLQERAVA